jgi:hypothetical protein
MLAYEITRFLENEEEEEDTYHKAICLSLEDAFRMVMKLYDYRSTISIIVWEDNQFLGETKLGGNE